MSRLSAPFLLILIVAAFFWKVFTKQFTWMDHPDMAYQILPWYQFQADLWHRGQFPIWDPRLWGGQPLIAQIVPSGAYPLNWILFMLPLANGHIQPLWLNLQFIITHCMAALFCYALCRDLKRSRPASMLAGAAFSCGGLVGTVGWPQMLNGAVWTPLVVLFYLRSTRGEHRFTSAALCGTFLGVSCLSGHHQVPVFLALMAASLWIYAIWRDRGMVVPFLCFGAFVFMTSALQLLPALEYGLRAVRWVGSQNPVFWSQYVPYSVHEHNSLYPLAVLNLVLPGVHGREDLFLGCVIVSLALAGVAAYWTERVVRVMAAMAAGTLVFALGGYSVFQGMAYLFVPMVEKARSPYMAIYLLQFALVVLAAYGVDGWLTGAARNSTWSRRWVYVLAGIGVLVWLFLAAIATAQQTTGTPHERLMILALVCFSLAALLHAWRSQHISNRAAAALVFCLMLFELGTVTTRDFHHRETPGGYLARLESNNDILEFLSRQPGPVRLEIDTDAVPYNIGDWDGIDSFRAFGAGLTSNVAMFEDDRLKGGRLASMLFALSYSLGSKPLRQDQEEVFSGKSGVKVYRNPEAFPRVWTAHEAALAQADNLMARLRTEQANLRRKVFLTNALPRLESCEAADAVKPGGRMAASVVVDVEMACQGMVVFSETFFPGWKATVDGKPTPIYEAYGVIRGVVVPTGAHRIEMNYRPASVYLGGALTAFALIAAAGLSFRSTRHSLRSRL